MLGKFFFTGATLASAIFLVNTLMIKKNMKKKEFRNHVLGEFLAFIVFLLLAIWRFSR